MEETWTLVASMVPEASIARDALEHAARMRHACQAAMARELLHIFPSWVKNLRRALSVRIPPKRIRMKASKSFAGRDGELEHLRRRDDRADGVDEEHGRQVGVYVASDEALFSSFLEEPRDDGEHVLPAELVDLVPQLGPAVVDVLDDRLADLRNLRAHQPGECPGGGPGT